MRPEQPTSKHEPAVPEPTAPETTSTVAQDVKQVIEYVGETLADEVEVIEERLGEATDSLPGSSKQIAIAIGAGLALIAGGAWWAVSRSRTRSRRLWRARGLALQRMWRRPELIARPHPSILSKAGKGLAATAITVAVKKGGNRLLQRAWPENPVSS